MITSSVISKYQSQTPRLRRLPFSAITSLALGACLLVAGSSVGCTKRESRIVNRTVIEVNGESISTKDYAQKLARALRNHDPLTVKDPQLLERTKNDLADAIILQLLTKQWAEKNGITIGTDDVERRVSEVRSEYADELAFRKMLAEENISIELFKAELTESLLKKRVYDKVTEGAKEPAEQEIKALYETNKKDYQRAARIRLRQVVLEKEEDAKRVFEEFQKGRDLGALAKQFSIVPEAADEGDTGWIEKGTLEVFDQAFKLSVGARSRIVKSPYGWHIYQVIGKEPERRLTLEQARPSLVRELKERRAQALFAQWLEEQIRSSTVKRDDAILRSISLSTRID
ncbi:MAG: peptidyl-prolyl cis-trans isomerase [Bdellovibrionales bacterium]|jgi:peptidyl-prolyl cis-trans isomerase C|nr:peptidyl-prolyl cis-trans isomerase [Bdellovibrionales bacterium]